MSASSSSTSVEPCLVCDKPGVLLCGACKRARFCSARCQRKVWSVHKVLCGRDPGSFYLPPLTPDELDELDIVKDKVVLQNFSTRTLLTLAYPGVDWPAFVATVSSTTAEPPNDIIRTELILFAHFHLATAQARGVSPRTDKGSVWRNFGHIVFGFVFTCIQEDKRGPGPQWKPFEATRRLVDVMRRQLVWSAVLHLGPESRTEDVALLRVCTRRIVEAIERAHVPVGAKAQLKEIAQAMLSMM